jgi:hypothetical protein
MTDLTGIRRSFIFYLFFREFFSPFLVPIFAMALLLLVVCRALIALPTVTQPRTPRIAQNKTRFSPITHCARGLGHTGLGLRACSCDGR